MSHKVSLDLIFHPGLISLIFNFYLRKLEVNVVVVVVVEVVVVGVVEVVQQSAAAAAKGLNSLQLSCPHISPDSQSESRSQSPAPRPHFRKGAQQFQMVGPVLQSEVYFL